MLGNCLAERRPINKLDIWEAVTVVTKTHHNNTFAIHYAPGSMHDKPVSPNSHTPTVIVSD